jgi:Anti-sigma-K factor rskA
VPHLDPDRLVLLALAEDVADETESAHLAVCAGCRAEIDDLKQVADLGSETQDLRDLPPPPERVWSGIKADLSVRAPAPPKRRKRRWLTPALSAAAAAVLAIAGTVAVIELTHRDPKPDVTARATLSPLATAPPTAHGTARVLSGDELQLFIRNLPLTTGYYEVWLIDPENTTKMMAVGNLSSEPGEVLPLPPGADLNRYRLVDVSAEAYDGNSAHSGKSLLRGTLTN